MLKIKATICFIIFSMMFQPLQANVKWGKTGHRIVGEIADQYLTNRTKRKIAKLLNHQSLALVSTYGDEIKSDARYAEFYSWHFVNMPFDQTYQESVKNVKGDLVTGIAYCKKIITDPKATDDDKVFYLKMLIHLIGDMHQPLHVGLEADKGGNDIKVQWQFKDTNLHSVWDSKMIDDYGMSYTELANNVKYLNKKEVKALQNGTIEDWVNDSQQVAKVIYASVNAGDNLRNEYMYLHFETLRNQLQKGGIRLAKVLNELF